jgi:hypothetical protein
MLPARRCAMSHSAIRRRALTDARLTSAAIPPAVVDALAGRDRHSEFTSRCRVGIRGPALFTVTYRRCRLARIRPPAWSAVTVPCSRRLPRPYTLPVADTVPYRRRPLQPRRLSLCLWPRRPGIATWHGDRSAVATRRRHRDGCYQSDWGFSCHAPTSTVQPPPDAPASVMIARRLPIHGSGALCGKLY